MIEQARSVSGPSPFGRDVPRVGVKVYGERNSGTNYLEGMLRRSLRCHVYPGNLPRRLEQITTLVSSLTRHHPAVQRPIEANRNLLFRCLYARHLGWKHAEVPVFAPGGAAYPEGTRFAVIVKNPYSWLLSLHRRPYQGQVHSFWRRSCLDEFIEQEWPSIRRENGASSYENPLDLWSRKVASYQRLDQYGLVARVRYEDLIASPGDEVRRMAVELSVPLVEGPIENIDESTKKDRLTASDYRDYYLRERWRDQLTRSQIDRINQRLDLELVRAWGYDVL